MIIKVQRRVIVHWEAGKRFRNFSSSIMWCDVMPADLVYFYLYQFLFQINPLSFLLLYLLCWRKISLNQPRSRRQITWLETANHHATPTNCKEGTMRHIGSCQWIHHQNVASNNNFSIVRDVTTMCVLAVQHTLSLSFIYFAHIAFITSLWHIICITMDASLVEKQVLSKLATFHFKLRKI